MINTSEEQLTIQHVSEITGLSVYTLRYYERIGLIHPIERAENTHRRYTDADIGWIDFLNKLRAMGMSIQEMQTYAQLQRQGDASLPELRGSAWFELDQRVEAGNRVGHAPGTKVGSRPSKGRLGGVPWALSGPPNHRGH